MTLRYWYDDAGEVRCENRHGLVFSLPGPLPEWRPRTPAAPRVTATPLVRGLGDQAMRGGPSLSSGPAMIGGQA